MPRYQKAQGPGVLSPSEIATLRRAKAESQRQKQILRDRGVLSPSEIVSGAAVGSASGTLTPSERMTLRNQGSMSPSEIRSRGYKYFPENP